MRSLCTPRTFLVFIVVTLLIVVVTLYGNKSSTFYQQQSSLVLMQNIVSSKNVFQAQSNVKETPPFESSQNVNNKTESGPVHQKLMDKAKQKETKEKDKPHPKPPQNIQYLFQTMFPSPTLANGYTCSNSMCSEFLNPQDIRAFTLSTRKCLTKSKREPRSINGPCHFMNGTNRSPVALASFPGSGNTWVRGLLELATGVCSGSVYTDEQLRMRGFNGESVRSGAVIAVKTHYTSKQTRWADLSSLESPGFGGAILIVRNPFDALVSDWTRERSKSHTGVVKSQIFGDNPKWNTFVHSKIKQWRSYFDVWLVNTRQHPTMVIRYEDLKSDVVKSMGKMLDYLKFPYDNEELKENLSKDFTTFKRKHNEETFEHFTMEQKETVRTVISQALTYLKAHYNGDTLGLEEYLR